MTQIRLKTGLDKGPAEVCAEVDSASDQMRPPSFLLTHGAGGSLATPGLRALGAALAERGFLVVRADLPYRAAGRKTPPKAESSVAGFAGVVQEARRRFGGRSWVVGGRSYGGRVASLAVAWGLNVSGLLLYSYPLHRPGDPSTPRVDHWPQISVPTLFLEGTNDPFCDPATFERCLPLLAGKATVHTVEGGDHSLRVSRKNAPDGVAVSEAKVAVALARVADAWAVDLAGC
ncbi:MAG: alpha/beta family hydrolase [Actinomycetota bacterium]